MITRFGMEHTENHQSGYDSDIVPMDNGEYILYTDHLAAVESLRVEIDKYDAAIAVRDLEIERLTTGLNKANAQAERFERLWYLRGNEIEALQSRAIPDISADDGSVQLEWIGTRNRMLSVDIEASGKVSYAIIAPESKRSGVLLAHTESGREELRGLIAEVLASGPTNE